MQQCIYNHIYIYYICHELSSRTHQSSAPLWNQAALDAMDVGPTLLQSNKARNSTKIPHWDPAEMGEERILLQNFSFFFLLFFREWHMVPWRPSWLEFVCPRTEKGLKLKTTSIYTNCGSSEQTGFEKIIARTYEWYLRTIIHFCSMLCFVSSTSWGAVPWYAW